MSSPSTRRLRLSSSIPARLAFALFAFSGALILAGPQAHAQAGDDCSTAFTAVEGSNGPVNLGTMTPSPDTPANGNCTALGWSPTTKDAWWVYLPTRSGRLSLDFCNSSFDTSVVVYTGFSCSSGLVRIDCDDDGCNNSVYQSAIDDLQVAAGFPVWIRVGGYLGAVGTVQFTLTLSETGKAVVWGSDYQDPPAFGAVQDVQIGGNHVVALRPDESVACFGDNTFGQSAPPAGLFQIVDVAAGRWHSIAARRDGAVFCWGANNSGQSTPPLGMGPLIRVAAGRDHSMALDANGTVRCWGSNAFGQSAVPPTLSIAREIAAGLLHSVAIARPGLVVCWGYNASGQSTVPAAVLATRVKAVAAGWDHTVALTRTGSVICWGSNARGQCTVPAGLGVVRDIAAAGEHTAALRQDGTVVCWGLNTSGQSTPPVGVAPFGTIEAGETGTIAIAFDADQNGVVDVLEVIDHDCNANGLHDAWDWLDELVEDCNDNGLGDSCEKSLTVALSSGYLTPIGAGSPQSYTIANVATALESPLNPVRLSIEARGDFGGLMEYVTLRIGKTFAAEALRGTADCGAGSPTELIEIDPADFNALIGPDGSITIEVEPSIAVDPFFCTPFTWARVRLEYTGSRPADCNANGLLDSCEIAAGLTPDLNANGVPDDCENPFTVCPTDLDGNGETGASDLAAVLGAWGSANPAFDLNGDGAVGAADLALLLSAWGPCLPN